MRILLAALLGLHTGLSALGQTPSTQPAESPPAASQPALDPAALTLLESVAARLSESAALSVKVDDSWDELTEAGQKLQFSGRRLITLRRPDRLRSDVENDQTSRLVQYDGKTLAIWDRLHNVYAQVAAPPTLDEAIRLAVTTYGVEMPLADFLMSNASAQLSMGVLTAQVVGEHRVGSEICHHLAFTQETVDWQAWVSKGESPVLRKLVIDFKQAPGSPQYVAVLSDWNLTASPAEEAFTFTPPGGAGRVELTPQTSQPAEGPSDQ